MRRLVVTLTQEEVTQALARVAREKEGLTFAEAKVHLEIERRRAKLPWCDERRLKRCVISTHLRPDQRFVDTAKHTGRRKDGPKNRTGLERVVPIDICR